MRPSEIQTWFGQELDRIKKSVFSPPETMERLFISTMSTASCVPPQFKHKDSVFALAEEHLTYSRDLARFKPGDVVYTTSFWVIPRTPHRILPKGTELTIRTVTSGCAYCATNDGETLYVPLDAITHRKPTERKEEDMGTGNTHEVHLYAVNSFDFKPRKIVKSYSKRTKTDSTIVFWNDGTKTIVKRAKDEPDNTYSAFTAALAIKLFGSNSALKKFIEKHTEEQSVKGKE